MLGAIIGDIIGSVYEKRAIKSIDFELFSEDSEFTDDTVLTIATADCILQNANYTEFYQIYGKKYPAVGYGGTFMNWIFAKNPQPYNSWGNGSAMRVSPVAYLFKDINEVLDEAEKTAVVTHNHPEGVKGAQAVAAAIYLANNDIDKAGIKDYIEKKFGYDLNRKIDDIRKTYEFDVSCQGSVPESIIAFFESTDYESAIRLAISLGGDADTMAAMAGSIAEAFYKEIPSFMLKECKNRLPDEFLKVIDEFYDRFNVKLNF
jgi:ADP-ribosyl-[dinitrogen reductase] hydrolase